MGKKAESERRVEKLRYQHQGGKAVAVGRQRF
jgi:hypothetical protein